MIKHQNKQPVTRFYPTRTHACLKPMYHHFQLYPYEIVTK
ncbi:hypothetical protein NEIMUCOT_05356 [Neisseria mucosa ATCC 25996]|uniref:Uncharacterized protein n=1 Tax=Neisseria mucosa (strain ATCC 25996 / DSM 4631 / NCTC 10774 / M26) TaxID=546266 RepID=D2ZXK2_NEIM2|nr:hypothetical protein NEIMUCOT_05356 [Neisseria mucosa ATCC 25996]